MEITAGKKDYDWLPKVKKLMSPSQVRQFIMYYERITKQMLVDLSKKAYAVLYLDKKHRLNRLKFN